MKVIIFTFSLHLQCFRLDPCGETLGIGALLCRFPTFPGGFDHTSLLNTARGQISNSMRNGCLGSSLLPLRVWWLLIIPALTHPMMKAAELVTNPCFSITSGVIRFSGSRWSIFTNKSIRRTKSRFSLSVTGKTWKTTTTTKEFKYKNCRRNAFLCFVYGLGESAVLMTKGKKNTDYQDVIQRIQLPPWGLACLFGCLFALANRSREKKWTRAYTLGFATLKFHKENVKDALIPLVSRKF